MRPILITIVFLHVALSLAHAADPVPKPTKEELDDIRHQAKQLSVYVYAAPELIKACEELGRFGRKATSAIPALLDTINSPDHKSEKVRAAALAAISSIGGPTATRAMTALAKHKEPSVRVAAQTFLAETGVADFPPLALMKKELANVDPALRVKATLNLIQVHEGTAAEREELAVTLAAGLVELATPRVPPTPPTPPATDYTRPVRQYTHREMIELSRRMEAERFRPPARPAPSPVNVARETLLATVTPAIERFGVERKAVVARAILLACQSPPPNAVPALTDLAAKHAQLIWAGKPSVESAHAAKSLLKDHQDIDLAILWSWDQSAKRVLVLELIDQPVAAELQIELVGILAGRVHSALVEVTYHLITKYSSGISGFGLPIVRDATNEELQGQRDRILAAHEKRVKGVADDYLAQTQKAGPAGRVILAKGFMQGCSEHQKRQSTMPEVRVLTGALREGEPFDRAKAAGLLAVVGNRNQDEVIKSLEAALNDRSSLVAAVAKEALTMLAKK